MKQLNCFVSLKGDSEVLLILMQLKDTLEHFRDLIIHLSLSLFVLCRLTSAHPAFSLSLSQSLNSTFFFIPYLPHDFFLSSLISLSRLLTSLFPICTLTFVHLTLSHHHHFSLPSSPFARPPLKPFPSTITSHLPLLYLTSSAPYSPFAL